MNSIETLINNIHSEFSGIRKPDVSLRQFKLTDEKGMKCEITDEEWYCAAKSRIDNQWHEIPDAEIEECGCLLGHMESEEYIYYLPAFICYALRCLRDDINDFDMLGSIAFFVYPSKNEMTLYQYVIDQMKLLSVSQKKVIIDYLEFVAENADEFDAKNAKIALERYWYEAISM